jgi:hypothetical protein
VPDEWDFTVCMCVCVYIYIFIFNMQCDAQNAVLHVSAVVQLPLNSGLLQITLGI